MGAPDCDNINPHGALAALVKAGLNVEVDAEKLRDTINNHWRRIQTLAHLIHDEHMREQGRVEIREQFKTLMRGEGQ